jgi:predicted Zn-ribbon and HTH transcriptional regulator
VILPEKFIGTTMRPKAGREKDALEEIAEVCAFCGYWVRIEDLDGEGRCIGCRDEKGEW